MLTVAHAETVVTLTLKQVMAKMLPRHMEIIEIINDGWTKWLESHVKDKTTVESMSIIHPNPWNKDEW